MCGCLPSPHHTYLRDVTQLLYDEVKGLPRVAHAAKDVHLLRDQCIRGGGIRMYTCSETSA